METSGEFSNYIITAGHMIRIYTERFHTAPQCLLMSSWGIVLALTLRGERLALCTNIVCWEGIKSQFFMVNTEQHRLAKSSVALDS